MPCLRQYAIKRVHVGIKWRILINGRLMMETTSQLDPAIEERLAKLVGKTGWSVDSCLRHLIEEGMSDMEDYYLATDALERVRSGAGKTYTSAEVRKELGLAD
jgi:RHH-type rel operon transcriptional repressor/antitoxin RelB